MLYTSHRPGGGVTFQTLPPTATLCLLSGPRATKPCIRQLGYLRGVLRAGLQVLKLAQRGKFSETFYSRSCIATRPVATPVIAGCREYPFSEFSDPLVLQEAPSLRFVCLLAHPPEEEPLGVLEGSVPSRAP